MSASSPLPAGTSAQALRALPWMAGWLSLMLIMAIAGRQATRELDVFQIMALRSLFGLLLLYPLVRANGGLRAMASKRLPQHVARNVVHYGAQYAWFVALTLIPLAQVVAIEFTMPIWTALLAATFLHERMHRWKIAAVVLGVLGVAMIVRPASTGISAGQAIALSAALGFAVSVILVKSLTRTESVVAIVFWMLVVQGVLGIWPALAVWRWPTPQTWAWVVLIAFCGAYSHYCLTRAIQVAEATVVVPMDFLRVPLTAIAGWLVFSEGIDLMMVLGTILILAGNLLNLRSGPSLRP
jgi:drug/metabolite transporter (DMT)-like permease